MAVTIGAVYKPELVTIPAVVDHLTALFVLPVTAALNCLMPPEYTVAVVGEIVTATLTGLPACAEREDKISIAQINAERLIDSFWTPA